MLQRPGLLLVVYLCLVAQTLVLVRVGVRMVRDTRTSQPAAGGGVAIPTTGPYTPTELRLARAQLEALATTLPAEGGFTQAQLAETAEARRQFERAGAEMERRRLAQEAPASRARRAAGWALIAAAVALVALWTWLALRLWRLMPTGRLRRHLS